MNTKSEPSLYRYCMSRLSTVAVSTLVPALNVRSTTLPESTFLSLVRTKAPPLPGLTCWNSTTDHSCPSRLSTSPFLRSFVVATVASPSSHVLLRRSAPSEDQQVLRGCRQQFRRVDLEVAHDEGVLDADATAAGQVDPGLDGHRRAGRQSTGRPDAQHRSLVDLQTDSVAEPVRERVGVPGACHDFTCRGVHLP